MTFDELKEKLKENSNEYYRREKELREEFNCKKAEIIDEYTKENHRFHIGDILCSNNRYIKVDSYYGTLDSRGVFYVTYKGPELTKKLHPRKDGFRTSFYDDGREITKIEKK